MFRIRISVPVPEPMINSSDPDPLFNSPDSEPFINIPDPDPLLNSPDPDSYPLLLVRIQPTTSSRTVFICLIFPCIPFGWNLISFQMSAPWIKENKDDSKMDLVPTPNPTKNREYIKFCFTLFFSIFFLLFMRLIFMFA